MVTSVYDRVTAVRQQIDEAAVASGRSPGDVTLLAVSKTQPLEKIVKVVKTGLIYHLGENRVQELMEKVPNWPSDLSVHWHLIGQLQRNKARKALELAHCIQSVDSLRLAETLQRICEETDRQVSVLLEVNTSGEASKSGVAPQEAEGLIEAILTSCRTLSLQGLMTIGPLTEDQVQIGQAFESLRALSERLRSSTGLELPVLSMGMSDDYCLAIKEGSTMVRIGTAIFGAR